MRPRPRPKTLLCQWTEIRPRPDGLFDCYCSRCERWTNANFTRQPVRNCGVQPPVVFLWGKLLSGGLGVVGVTAARVGRVAGKPCGCKHRARALDRAGIRLFLRLRSWRRRLGRYNPLRRLLCGLLSVARRRDRIRS